MDGVRSAIMDTSQHMEQMIRFDFTERPRFCESNGVMVTAMVDEDLLASDNACALRSSPMEMWPLERDLAEAGAWR